MAIPLADLAPRHAAEVLVDRHADDPEWIDELTAALDRRRRGRELERILEVWGLSRSEAGRRFGVSRQAVAKWISGGVPADRLEAVADLGAATDLLVRFLKRERIAAVVRRPSAALGGRSLLDLVAMGGHREVLEACREMFDFARIPA